MMNGKMICRVRTLVLASLALTMSTIATAQEVARKLELNWDQLKQSGKLEGGEIVADEAGNGKVLKFEGSEPAATGIPQTIALTQFEVPMISTQAYVLSGLVKYSNVEGDAFFDMWSYFPDGSHYFSRTLASTGPLQSLTGTSDWRPVQLPFSFQNSSVQPSRVTLSLVMPDKGTIWLNNFEFREIESLASIGNSNAWWTGSVGAWIGTIVGCSLGLIGTIVGILAASGRGRAYMLPLLVFGSILGVVLALVGIVALANGQPYNVYYPMLLAGGLCSFFGVFGFFRVRQHYATVELRRMNAHDA